MLVKKYFGPKITPLKYKICGLKNLILRKFTKAVKIL